MHTTVEVVQALMTYGPALLTAAYGVACAVPGDHPDKEILWLLQITKKLSRK